MLQIVELEGVRVGMTHGHMIMPRGNDMALDAERRRLNVDVLLSASTGRASTKQHGSGLLVDPGSITGIACSPLASHKPSFTLLSLDNGKVSAPNHLLPATAVLPIAGRPHTASQPHARPPSNSWAAVNLLALHYRT